MLSIKHMVMFIWLYGNVIPRKWINNEHTALWAALLSILIKEWSLIWWNFVEYFGGNGRILRVNHWYGLVSRILTCMGNIRRENSSRGEKLRWIKKLFGIFILFFFIFFFIFLFSWKKIKKYFSFLILCRVLICCQLFATLSHITYIWFKFVMLQYVLVLLSNQHHFVVFVNFCSFLRFIFRFRFS